MGSEPRVKMGWAGAIAPPVAVLLTVGAFAGVAALTGDLKGSIGGMAIAAGFGIPPALLFPIAMRIVGRAPVTVFAVGVFAASTLHLILHGAIAVLAREQIEPAFGGSVPRYEVGLIVGGLVGLTAETLAAVATLRPTWDLADSSGSPDSGPWNSPPNGPTTVPSDGDPSETPGT